MTELAVRKWLAGVFNDPVTGIAALTGKSVSVYDAQYKTNPTDDQILFYSFESEEEPISFGNVGSRWQVTYTPELLILLIDPEAEDAQYTLDAYVGALRKVLRNVGEFIALTDPNTAETSKLAYVHPRVRARKAKVEDLSAALGEEGDVLASVLVVPTLYEHYTKLT